jgi:galactan 5-O-arabinofuranosyltransferase
MRTPASREQQPLTEPRVFATAVVGVLVALGTLLVTITPHAQSGDPTVDVAARLWLVVCTAVAIVVIRAQVPRAMKGILVSVVVGAALMLAAALVLSANDFAPLGAVLDQSHRTALLTKYAYHWGWVDFAYKGLPDSYPPLTFWILGRLAALFSIAPWKMLKVDVLATAFLAPVLSWPLWRRVVGRTAGVAAVLGGTLLFQAWYRPMAWLGVALFVPWWLWGVLGVGRAPARSRRELVVAAVIGAALFCTYYYPFFIGVLALLVTLAVRRLAAARGVELSPRDPKAAGFVLGGTAVLSAPYWLPLVVSIVRDGYQSNSNRYYIADFVDLRFRFLTFDVIGIVMLFGLGYLIVTARRSPVSLGLVGVLAATLVYYVADYVGVLAGLPLLSFESNQLVDAILGVGAGLGLVHLWRLARSSEALRARLGRGGVAAASWLGATILAFSLAQTAIKTIPYVDQQRTAQEPVQLIQDFRRAAGGPVDNRVVLTDLSELPAFLPLYVFNWWDTQSPTTPGARVNDRTDFLDRLSRESDPEAFAVAILHNVYDRVDYIVLRRNSSGGFEYTFTDDNFPRPPVARTFTYHGAQFGTPVFRRIDTTSFTLFRIARQHDPLRSLRSCPSDPSRDACQILGTLTRRYPGHLDGAVLDLAARWRASRARAGGAVG